MIPVGNQWIRAFSNIPSTFHTSIILDNGQWEHFVNYNSCVTYSFIHLTGFIKKKQTGIRQYTLRAKGELEIIFQGLIY